MILGRTLLVLALTAGGPDHLLLAMDEGAWPRCHRSQASWKLAPHATQQNFMRLIFNVFGAVAFFRLDDCRGGMI